MTTKASLTKPIPAKRKLFAERFVVSRNGSKAAEEAGYAKNRSRQTANELMKDQRVLDIIFAGIEKVSKENGIDAQTVLLGAKKMFDRCMQEEAVTDKDGNKTGEYKFDSAGAGKALKLMGDHVQVNAFKATDDDGVPIDQHWTVEIVHTTRDAKTHPSSKA